VELAGGVEIGVKPANLRAAPRPRSTLLAVCSFPLVSI
jgi:hypothetical protein